MSESSPINPCPTCGAAMPHNAPQGLCPKCLLLGVAAPTETGEAKTSTRPPPPPLESVAAAFPQLEILELIGQGGMGCVFKARQPQLNRFVALKILPEALGRDATFATRFTREAQALAALSHPNIVTIHDFGQAGGFFYLLMEFVDGVNLRQALRGGRLTPEEALAIVPPLCDAMQFAHDRSIVHRDIKPENLLLDKDGRIKIADFGIAKMLVADGSRLWAKPQPQQSGAVDAVAAGPKDTAALQHSAAGTPGYMAPEQKATPEKVDHRADIYSLGVVFYEMLTGELPGDKLQPPSRKVQIDVRLDEIVLRALKQTPELRYQTAADFKTQVETIATTPTSAVPTPPIPWMNRGMDYRSRMTIFGLPLLHVTSGIDPTTGKQRTAQGIIAIGGVARGVVAFGGVAMGGLAFGGMALGVVAFGGCAIGLMSYGGLAIALLVALGGGAMAPIALGGGAVGYLVFAGQGFGAHVLDAMTTDPVAERFFLPWAKALMARMQWINVAFLGVFLPIAVGVPIWLRRRETGHQFQGGTLKSPPRRPLWKRGWTQLAVVTIFAITIRAFFLEPFSAATDAAGPEIPRGSRFLVWKLSRNFTPGDLIAYRSQGLANVGRVIRSDADALLVNRNSENNASVPRKDILGKVVSVYWRGANQAPQTGQGVTAEAFSRAIERRKFVRLVVDFASMTFEGQSISWDDLGVVLANVPDRANTVLEFAVTSDQITVAQQNQWFQTAVALARQHGFEYASFIGIHPLGSKGAQQSEDAAQPKFR